MHPNQAARDQFTAWRADVSRDWMADDPHFCALLRRYGLQSHRPSIDAFARDCATVIDPLARLTNEDAHLPRLRTWDGQGHRVEQIDFHPSYHQIGRIVYGTGLMGLYAEPGQELHTLATLYLLSQNGEAGHACPQACTAGLIKMVQRASNVPDEWLSRLYEPDYDRHMHGAQFLTEVQGGSDVGANAVMAEPTERDGWWSLTGEKWFCSVIDAQLMLITARKPGGTAGTRGLHAFAVPRTLDGAVNGLRIRRLKDKLGTRSMASAEVDLVDARGVDLGPFKDVVQIVLNTSRLYNGVACAGVMQRAWREAHAYAWNRQAFGQPIANFPSTARIIASIRAQAYGARASSFEAAALADRIALGTADATQRSAWRALVNLNKFWTAVRCTLVVRDAIEVMGGNGAIESFSVLPRLLRDSVVLEAWEGGHNVLCAQVTRDCLKLGVHHALFEWLGVRVGPDA
ncbi:MAG: acyl-CoA dehydrogenase, partial [Kiritimatiellia bacterium]